MPSKGRFGIGLPGAASPSALACGMWHGCVACSGNSRRVHGGRKHVARRKTGLPLPNQTTKTGISRPPIAWPRSLSLPGQAQHEPSGRGRAALPLPPRLGCPPLAWAASRGAVDGAGWRRAMEPEGPCRSPAHREATQGMHETRVALGCAGEHQASQPVGFYMGSPLHPRISLNPRRSLSHTPGQPRWP